MKKEKAILVLLNENNKFSEKEIEYKIEELKELVRASNGEAKFTVVQNGLSINSKYFIGSGKSEEIKELAENNDIDLVVFNHELSGSQIKNLEDIIDRKIVDRTGLILDIFSTRAKTKESKLQIKLAQLEYRLPRLVGFRNYLSREGAGIGTRGPGEQKLEIDRRTIQREISSIKNQLKDVKKKRDTKRKRRINSKSKLVSLVGYSNSGKSTILNQLTRISSDSSKEVYSDDLLFATLDTSARRITLNNHREIIVTDTVGFISDLPTKLVESFKSTLEEIEGSDLIAIVMDSSNPNYQNQLEATFEVLDDLNISDIPKLFIFNKQDLVINFNDYNNFENEIYISAFNEKDINLLMENMEKLLYQDYKNYKVHIPYPEFDKLKEKKVLNSEDEFTERGIITTIMLNDLEKEKYKDYLIL